MNVNGERSLDFGNLLLFSKRGRVWICHSEPFLEYFFNREDGRATCLDNEHVGLRRRSWELKSGGKSWYAWMPQGDFRVFFSSWPTNWPAGQELTVFNLCYDPDIEYEPYTETLQLPFQYCQQSKTTNLLTAGEGGGLDPCAGRTIRHTAQRTARTANQQHSF